jgi:surface antigen Omp85-like protein
MKTTRMLRTWLVLAVCGFAPAAGAQEADSSGAVARPGFMARTLSWTESRMDPNGNAVDGFYPELGGLIIGSGVALGPGYRKHVFGDRLFVDTSAAVSWRGYHMTQVSAEWRPRAGASRISLGADAKHADFTQINFFGVGDASHKSDQTDYRLAYIDVGGFGTVRAAPWMSITGRVGLLRRAEVRSGRSALHPSIEERFDDDTAPGLARQPNYQHADLTIDADTRDLPGYASRGGHYRASLAAFRDREYSQYSFRRFEADAVQYVPLYERAVVAVRARVDASQTGAGQQVPFYVLPALGSQSSLRGYADYRFRDRNALLLSSEFRFPMMKIVDGAVFYDTGATAPTLGDALSMRTRHSDYGVGLRVHSPSRLLARLDIARGTEGTRIIASFSPSLEFSKRATAPFVP